MNINFQQRTLQLNSNRRLVQFRNDRLHSERVKATQQDYLLKAHKQAQRINKSIEKAQLQLKTQWLRKKRKAQWSDKRSVLLQKQQSRHQQMLQKVKQVKQKHNSNVRQAKLQISMIRTNNYEVIKQQRILNQTKRLELFNDSANSKSMLKRKVSERKQCGAKKIQKFWLNRNKQKDRRLQISMLKQAVSKAKNQLDAAIIQQKANSIKDIVNDLQLTRKAISKTVQRKREMSIQMLQKQITLLSKGKRGSSQSLSLRSCSRGSRGSPGSRGSRSSMVSKFQNKTKSRRK